MHQPDLYFLGIRFQEPMTVITNLLITGFCFYGYWVLQKENRPEKVVQYLKLYLLFLGYSAFFGGVVGHGFYYFFGQEGRLPGWVISIVAIYFMECSALEYASKMFKAKNLQMLNWLNLGVLGLLIGLTVYYQDFKYVIFHSVYGFIGVVFTLHYLMYKKTNDPASLYILKGIGMLLIAVSIFGFRVSPHHWFNQNDLSHLFVVWACYLFLQAGLTFHPTTEMETNKID